jgi:cytoskeletal protein CcmA (bactofilin family)
MQILGRDAMSNPYNSSNHNGASVLGPTLSFKGELRADEDLLIRGKIEGTIQHSSNLKIGKEGKIKAKVNAEYIEVHGEVKGDLTGSKSVVVKDSANITGNIYSPSVSLYEGAKFNGNIDMSGKTQPASKSPEAPRQSSEERNEPVVEKTVDAGQQPETSEKRGKKVKVAAKPAANAA